MTDTLRALQPRALFIAPSGDVYPDYLVCSGVLPAELGGRPCPYSEDGRMPEPQRLEARARNYSADKGKPGDLCPPCAKQALGPLGRWDGHHGCTVLADLHPLRLFKCRMWMWLVVPGLLDAQAGAHPVVAACGSAAGRDGAPGGEDR